MRLLSIEVRGLWGALAPSAGARGAPTLCPCGRRDRHLSVWGVPQSVRQPAQICSNSAQHRRHRPNPRNTVTSSIVSVSTICCTKRQWVALVITTVPALHPMCTIA